MTLLQVRQRVLESQLSKEQRVQALAFFQELADDSVSLLDDFDFIRFTNLGAAANFKTTSGRLYMVYVQAQGNDFTVNDDPPAADIVDSFFQVFDDADATVANTELRMVLEVGTYNERYFITDSNGHALASGLTLRAATAADGDTASTTTARLSGFVVTR